MKHPNPNMLLRIAQGTPIAWLPHNPFYSRPKSNLRNH